MIKQVFIFVAFLSLLSGVVAQKDPYDQLKTQYDSLRKAENHEGALLVAKQMNAWALQNETDTSLRYAVSLRYVGNCFNSANMIDSAIIFYNKSLHILKERNRDKSLEYEKSLVNLGLIFFIKGDYRKSVKYYFESSIIIKEILGENSIQYAVCLSDIADAYFYDDDFKSALGYYQKAIAILNINKIEEIILYTNCLNNLGLSLKELNLYEDAVLCFLEVEEFYSKSTNVDNYQFAKYLYNIGSIYNLLDDLDSAKIYFEKTILISRNLYKKDRYYLARSSHDLGVLFSNLNIIDSALFYFKLATEEFSLIDFNQEYLICAQNLGRCYLLNYYYSECEEFLLDTYKSCLELGDAFQEEINGVIFLLGDLYKSTSDYEKSIFYYMKLLTFFESNEGKFDADYSILLNDIGVVKMKLNDYKSAEEFLNKSLTLKSKIFGNNHLEYAHTLNDLGLFYNSLGNYNFAEKYLMSAFEIYKEQGDSELDLSRISLNLGVLYFDKGELEKSKVFFNQSLLQRKMLFDTNNPDFANVLNNLGLVYYEMDYIDSAEYLFLEASKIYQIASDSLNEDFAMVLNNLGNLYSDIGRLDESKTYYLGSMNIYKELFSSNSEEYCGSLQNLASLETELKKYKGAMEYYSEIFNSKSEDIENKFLFLQSNEKDMFWQNENYIYSILISFSVSAVDSVPSSTELSYNANLISKSLLLETSRELDQAITQSSDEEMKAQFAEMKQLRKLYSKMQSEGSANKEVMERNKIQADSLDKILVNKLGEFAASKRKFDITWKDVQSNLTTSDAAIEFARYYDDKDSLYKYMALVVRPDYEYPKLVCLGEEEDIRTATQNKAFSALYNEAWKGIDSLLVGVKCVYYSPAGELNNVSFSALCTEEGNELVATNTDKNRGVVIGNNNTTTKACNAVLMDKYELHQLTTTRYLADGTLKKEKPMQPSLALMGGINFDDIPEKTMEADKAQSNEDFALQANLRNRTASTNGKKRGKRSSSNYGKKMEPLPGTKEEVVNIAGLLNTSNWKVQTKSDKKAGEYGFKKELETKAPGVLHIATHGFAFPDEAEEESKLMDINQTSTYKVSEDPMVRCGLMLGGSNISWTGNPQKMIEQTGDDGILTAAEVANLDLSNTKLVVLSACETGLGKIEGSEGTFGLKRGFKLAGVEQMIVSLWSVPDKETMELMTLFYSDLTKTLNPVTSFEKAQKEMRNRYPTDPEKWAGFVLVR